MTARDGASGPRFQQETIGRYRIDEVLGQGGQGLVYRAFDTRMRRDVALKVLHATPGEHDALLQRFEREALIVARLDDEGICRVHDVGTASGVAYMAMDLVPGMTLAEAIDVRRETPPHPTQGQLETDAETIPAIPAEMAPTSPDATIVIDQGDSSTVSSASPDRAHASTSESPGRSEILRTCRQFEQLARSLHRAHEAGVVHRDLKPGNIMLRPDGRSVLLDFGLARADDQELIALTQSSDLFGTPAYMSPEQLSEGAAGLDRSTDVYSLGVCLYEALTLELPHQGSSRESLFRAILQDPAPDARRINAAIPDDLHAVLEACLEKDPRRRIQDAGRLADELRCILEHRPTSVRPPGPWGRTSRWARRNPVVASLAGLLFATLVSSTVWSVVQNARLQNANAALRFQTRTAERNAEQARDEAVKKTVALAGESQALRAYERLADTKRLEEAREESEALWPAHPRHAERLLAWERTYEPLFARLGEHREALRVLEQSEGAREVGGRWTFESPDQRFRHDIQSRLVRDLEAALAEMPTALVRSIAERRDRIEHLEWHSRSSAEAVARWDAVRTRIASNPRYARNQGTIEGGAVGEQMDAEGRLILVPQFGLVPLGPDPRSGLEEFLHLETHELADGTTPPSREELSPGGVASGIHCGPGTGVVLVLLPAGRFAMGAQIADPSASNHDPTADAREGPVHDVALSSFFMSKFEMTQGQWYRAARQVGAVKQDPSSYGKGSFEGQKRVLPRAVGDDHPVENVSWTECVELSRRVGLVLPTEAQWEFAARADLAYQRWPGTSEIAALGRLANISGKETRGVVDPWHFSAAHRDPYCVHAPVGSFQPNGFGLHDLAGNLFEWCLDAFAPNYETPARSGDGLRSGDGGSFAYRGGSFAYPADNARLARRYSYNADQRDHDTGLRPARAIQR